MHPCWSERDQQLIDELLQYQLMERLKESEWEAEEVYCLVLLSFG